MIQLSSLESNSEEKVVMVFPVPCCLTKSVDCPDAVGPLLSPTAAGSCLL